MGLAELQKEGNYHEVKRHSLAIWYLEKFPFKAIILLFLHVPNIIAISVSVFQSSLALNKTMKNLLSSSLNYTRSLESCESIITVLLFIKLIYEVIGCLMKKYF